MAKCGIQGGGRRISRTIVTIVTLTGQFSRCPVRVLLFPQLLAAADGRMLTRPAWKLMSAAFGRNYLYMPH